MPVETVSAANGLRKLKVSDSSGSTAEVYLQGAQLTSWIPARGSEMIFLSKASLYRPGAAIRGGTPVVFPQFADLGPLPKHGIVRTVDWESQEPSSASRAALALKANDESRKVWPHEFRASIVVEPAGQTLTVRLSIENTGKAPFSFAAALHTYFRVADCEQARITGLSGTKYRDRGNWSSTWVEDRPVLTISGELDRVYIDSPRAIVVSDEAMPRKFQVSQEGFSDTVVWNPGAELAAKLTDMQPHEYREMLCIEAAQVMQPAMVQPGKRWEGSQRVEVID
ncbi:MAG TPA: D-hexose-6-phosphate mutarotase [Opitutaceae bacterium]|nr:D-hexose-6-phosphate mutarotase [Opitutaceae bacterium]